MAIDVNGVKAGATLRRNYITIAIYAPRSLKIIEEVGPDAFSLRAAARHAGVGPAVPAHHFRDTRGLLTAIAMIGFVEFGDALEAATEPNQHSIVIAQCHAHLFRCGAPRLVPADVAQRGAGYRRPRAHRSSDARVCHFGPCVCGPDPAMVSPGDPALAPTIACWSMVHGFVALNIDGALFAREAETRGTFDAMLDVTLQHLEVL